jgi:hypothetical protein
MKIPKKSIKVDNLFPIRLWKSRGKVYLANYGDDVYEVLNFKNVVIITMIILHFK